MQFQVEVRPRSSMGRAFVVYYQIAAGEKQAAVAEAMRRFSEQKPDEAVADYRFRVARS